MQHHLLQRPLDVATNSERDTSPKVIVPVSLAWHQKLAGLLIYLVLRLVGLTCRIRFQDNSQLPKDFKGPVIFAIWHNRLALTPFIWHRYCRKNFHQDTISSFVSASKDGGILVEVLRRFQMQSVRGSSSRRGRQALLEAARAIEKGSHMAITPDGPRGPRYLVQHGVISLASVTGSPIIPVRLHLPGKISLKSWDRFQIPLPLSNCRCEILPGFFVGKDISDEERDSLVKNLQDQLGTD
ncbi:MAG: hypothetical protein JWN25_83 [Verrucomicrobiales bacterium]|nr:hypothetical protein [Verrucomicrobiales bacterium]MDB6130828.1 hypothetical protein [Verrucomicrobiales bacterium]